MRVALDRQHQGKPSAPADRGAQFSDGTTEAFHAERYGQVARQVLTSAGIDVLWLTNGEYADRNRAANAAHCDLYVALHVNAGATDPAHVYALTEYASDAGVPSLSQRAAAVLLTQAATDLQERAVGPKALRSGERGHVCVAACRMPAVIYEPEFTIAARDDMAVGASLARGILAYLGVPQPRPAPTPTPDSGRTFEETDVKTKLVSVPAANGFGLAQATWDPELGRDPVIVGAVINGPDPSTADGWAADLAQATARASARNGKALVVVSGVKNSAACDVWVTVA